MTNTGLPCKKHSRKRISAKVKRSVLDRFGFKCVYCGVSLTYERKPHPFIPDVLVSAGDWPIIDHDIPVARGGTDDNENLVASCSSCNNQKRSLTGGEYRKWRTERGL